MNERTKIGLEILQAGVVVGVAGDLLLRATPWGLNVLAFNLIFVAAVVLLVVRHARHLLTVQTIALLGAQVFFAAMFVWRDAIELRVADTFAILAILGVLFVPKLGLSARVAGVFQYIAGFAAAAAHALFAPFVLVFGDVKWAPVARKGWQRHFFSVLRGLIIATPLVLVFGALFVAADAAFEGLVQRVFNLNIEIDTVMSHVALFLVFGWMTAGYLRGVLMNAPWASSGAAAALSVVPIGEPAETAANESKIDRVREESGEYPVSLGDHTVVEHLNISDPPNPPEEDQADATPATTAEPTKKWSWASIDNSFMPPAFTLGSVEIGVVLGLVNLLFLSFVVVQVPYLFGGMELVRNTPDFKLADYARRGFGELVAVAGLVLPMLLASHWLIRKETPRALGLYRVLAGVQIALLFVIMASAVQRLLLLTGELGYGLTTVRLYPMIFMIWLAVVFVWFGLTVLRGTRRHFAWGALWSAFFILGATHVLNPDRFIVDHNVALMREGRTFDAPYLAGLSDDALPALIEALPEMDELAQRAVVYDLARRYCQIQDEKDIRNWNVSRSHVRSVLESNSGFVDTLGGCASGHLQWRKGLDR